MNWWRHVMALEFRKILAFRSDFWITFVGQTLTQLLIARALWSALFDAQNVTEINGYTLPIMTLYYVIAPIGQKVLLGENFGFIAREVYDGGFTRYLIYPLSVFQYKTSTYLAHSLFYAVQLFIMVLLIEAWLEPVPFNKTFVLNLLLGCALYLFASICFMAMAMVIELFSLWADNIWSLGVILRFSTSFFGGGLIPLAFFPKWSLEILAYTPFPYFVSLPIRTILGMTTMTEISTGIIVIFIWTLISMGLVTIIWKKGQLRYTGVGQ